MWLDFKWDGLFQTKKRHICCAFPLCLVSSTGQAHQALSSNQSQELQLLYPATSSSTPSGALPPTKQHQESELRVSVVQEKCQTRCTQQQIKPPTVFPTVLTQPQFRTPNTHSLLQSSQAGSCFVVPRVRQQQFRMPHLFPQFSQLVWLRTLIPSLQQFQSSYKSPVVQSKLLRLSNQPQIKTPLYRFEVPQIRSTCRIDPSSFDGPPIQAQMKKMPLFRVGVPQVQPHIQLQVSPPRVNLVTQSPDKRPVATQDESRQDQTTVSQRRVIVTADKSRLNREACKCILHTKQHLLDHKCFILQIHAVFLHYLCRKFMLHRFSQAFVKTCLSALTN